MTGIEILLCVGMFMASFAMGYVNAAQGDPLGLSKIGFLPRR